MSEQNKEIVRQFVNAWDAGDTDSFGDYLATDVVDHQAFPGQAPGIAGIVEIASMMQKAFPGATNEIHNLIAEGDLVSGVSTLRGTHEGDFMGMPATGKPFTVTAIDITRFADGKMVEHWGLIDQAGMMIQLGLMPLPPGAEGWQPPPIAPQMKAGGSGNAKVNRAALKNMTDGVAAGDLEKVMGSIAADALDHGAVPGQPAGKEGVRWRFEQLFGGLSNPKFTVLSSVAEGPFLSSAFTFSAKHTGPMMGMPPTNKSFEVSAIDFALFENGQMRELWGLIDLPAIMMQLGLMEAPG
jgi:steroid delta-isomerase-like uncharacterized protein